MERTSCLPIFSFKNSPREHGRSACFAAHDAPASLALSVLRAIAPPTPELQRARAHSASAALRPDDSRCRASAAMERYARGEERAFEELYGLLAARLYRLCIYLIGRGEAEELMQEVFLKMHRARESFVPGGSVVAWSFAIARTTCLDRMRRRMRRPETAIDQEQLEARAASPESCPESASAALVLESVLEERLHALSESLRCAYVLVKVEGLSCAEAGAALGVSTSAIKQRVHRASEELKAGLSAAGW